MKEFICLASVLLSLTFLSLNAGGIKLSSETICIDDVPNSSLSEMLEGMDPGHHKTILKLEKYPIEMEYILTVKRSKIRKTENFNLHFDVEKMRENAPLIFVTSKYFMPGEKIELIVSTKNGHYQSEGFSLVPNPMIKFDRKNEAKVTVEMVAFAKDATDYRILLEGFQEGEKIQFLSKSADEEIAHGIEYKSINIIYYSPAVIGKSGGIAELSFIRENGEQITMTLPWGDALFPYLKGEVKPLISNFPTSKQTQL